MNMIYLKARRITKLMVINSNSRPRVNVPYFYGISLLDECLIFAYIDKTTAAWMTP